MPDLDTFNKLLEEDSPAIKRFEEGGEDKFDKLAERNLGGRDPFAGDEYDDYDDYWGDDDPTIEKQPPEDAPAADETSDDFPPTEQDAQPASQKPAPTQTVKAQGVPMDATSVTTGAFGGNLDGLVINPVPNELDYFATYTYNITLYMMSPKNYITMLRNPTSFEDIPKTTIARSGGIGQDNPPDSPFAIDFFIDDLSLINVAASPTKMAANTNACDISFTITEPNGITLLERLIEQAKLNLEEDMNYLQTPYCLEIAFKGYDIEGRPSNVLVMPKRIPIRITDFKFSVETSGAQYKVTAIPYNQNVFKGITQSIPINVQVKATTVGDIFAAAGGTFKTQQVPDGDETLDGTPNTYPVQIVTGDTKNLADAMNNYEVSLTKPRKVTTKDPKTKKEKTETKPPDQELANEYSFKLAPQISQAKLQRTNFDAQNTSTDTSKLYKNFAAAVKGKVNLDPTKGLYRINSGTGLVNLINYILVGSSYIERNILDDFDANGAESSYATKPISWYKIKPKITDVVGWDKKAGRYKFKIRYDIVPSNIYYNDFPFAPKSKPKGKGVHKVYDYFFTGRNTQVNSFKLDFDTAYYQAQTIGTGKPQADKPAGEAFVTQTKSNTQSREGQGLKTDDTDKEKRAKDLFSTIMNDGTDLIDLKLDIVGDPCYLPTGDSFWQDKELNGQMYTSAFLPDRTLNYDISPPFVQVNLLTPTDYDPQTGLMDPTTKKKFGASKFSGVYQVTEIKSNFAGGLFTQSLSGFRTHTQPLPDGKVNRGPETVKNEERKQLTKDDLLKKQNTNGIESFQKNIKSLGARLSDVAKSGVTDLPVPDLLDTSIPESIRDSVDTLSAEARAAASDFAGMVDDFGFGKPNSTGLDFNVDTVFKVGQESTLDDF